MNVVLMQIYICILFEGAKHPSARLWNKITFLNARRPWITSFKIIHRERLWTSAKSNGKEWRKFFGQKKFLSFSRVYRTITHSRMCFVVLLYSSWTKCSLYGGILPSWFSKDIFSSSIFVQFLRLNLFPLLPPNP